LPIIPTVTHLKHDQNLSFALMFFLT